MWFKFLSQRGCAILRRHLGCSYSSSASGLLNKKIVEKFASLPLPKNTVMADYIWIDGSGTYLRSKTRLLHFIPTCVEDMPQWMIDGTKTQQAHGSESYLHLLPIAVYRDPFRLDDAKIVLCETYQFDFEPTDTNHRACFCETYTKVQDHQPNLSFEQDFMLTEIDGTPLGWPSGGLEMPPTGKYYCGVGSASSIGRDIVEAHARACLFAGVNYLGFNQDRFPSKWKFRIGPINGVKGPDDVVISRYLLCRVAEKFGVEATFHPKLIPHIDGNALRVGFSTNNMLNPGGMDVIRKALSKLSKRHKDHMQVYDPEGGECNKLRLGSCFNNFTCGTGAGQFSIRIPKQVCKKGCGYFEDCRPAANADPYAVSEVLLDTVLCS